MNILIRVSIAYYHASLATHCTVMKLAQNAVQYSGNNNNNNIDDEEFDDDDDNDNVGKT